jgi:UDP-N-acetylmuramoylalanine--D-glutamate ligase
MKIAIAGYGIEGQENYRYWAASPDNEVTIVDENGSGAAIPEGAKSIVGDGAFAQLNGFDLVIRTAGLAPRKITTDGKIWSATNEFFEKCPSVIIGVTGSKGKGTTASLVASILKKAGRKVWLVGNIGISALSVLDEIQPDDIVVYELSSFQLWDIQKSPHTAVVLFIEQEHLDVHESMEEYVQAKANITRFQNTDDTVVFNAHNEYATGIAGQSSAQKVAYPSSETAHVDGDWFYYGQQKIAPVTSLTIAGVHNIDNALAAIDAVWEYTKDFTAIEAGLAAFKGLPHRLAYVTNVNDVEYYDDSIATTPGSAIAALRAFTDKQKVIILGGSSKGSDFTELAMEMKKHAVYALLIGDEAAALSEAFRAVNFEKYEIIENATAEKFTQRAAELSQLGGVVLLSPAAASFGLFKNYVDRGEQFIAAVEALAAKG